LRVIENAGESYYQNLDYVKVYTTPVTVSEVRDDEDSAAKQQTTTSSLCTTVASFIIIIIIRLSISIRLSRPI